MKEKEYFKLVREAEMRFQRDLDAIKRVWRLSHGGPPPIPKTPRPAMIPTVAKVIGNTVPATFRPSTRTAFQSAVAAAGAAVDPSGAISRVVTDIVLKNGGEFSIHDVAKMLRESYPSVQFQVPYLSSILMRLRVRGMIKFAGERAPGEPQKYIRA